MMMNKKNLAVVLAGSMAAVSACGTICAAAEPVEKDETVYVLTNPDGSARETIVSDWLKNTDKSDTINDTSELTDVKNVKGDETFTQDGESYVWDAKGNDIYYQGNTDKTLPVEISITYTVDGEAVDAADMAGKSGKVVIRYDFTNNEKTTVQVNNEDVEVNVPFVMLTGLVLDNSKFTNIEVTNGSLINDGDRTLVAGISMPGMKDSLGLKKDMKLLPDYMEITADVEDFSLLTSVSVALNDFSSAEELTETVENTAEKAEDSTEAENLVTTLQSLPDAITQLSDGSSALYDGLDEILGKSQELFDGIDQLTDGMQQVSDGADTLKTGSAQAAEGAASLNDGLQQLSANSGSLQDGGKQIFDSLLSQATTQLKAAGLSDIPDLTTDNYGTILGVIGSQNEQVAALKDSLDSYNTFYQGLMTYTDGVDTASAGAQSLQDGTAQISDVSAILSDVINTVLDGLKSIQENKTAYLDGMTQLRDGAKQIADGVGAVDQKELESLSEITDTDVSTLLIKLQAIEEAANSYESFSGISDDCDGSVRFIYRADSIGE